MHLQIHPKPFIKPGHMQGYKKLGNHDRTDNLYNVFQSAVWENQYVSSYMQESDLGYSSIK